MQKNLKNTKYGLENASLQVLRGDFGTHSPAHTFDFSQAMSLIFVSET